MAQSLPSITAIAIYPITKHPLGTEDNFHYFIILMTSETINSLCISNYDVSLSLYLASHYNLFSEQHMYSRLSCIINYYNMAVASYTSTRIVVIMLLLIMSMKTRTGL